MCSTPEVVVSTSRSPRQQDLLGDLFRSERAGSPRSTGGAGAPRRSPCGSPPGPAAPAVGSAPDRSRRRRPPSGSLSLSPSLHGASSSQPVTPAARVEATLSALEVQSEQAGTGGHSGPTVEDRIAARDSAGPTLLHRSEGVLPETVAGPRNVTWDGVDGLMHSKVALGLATIHQGLGRCGSGGAHEELRARPGQPVSRWRRLCQPRWESSRSQLPQPPGGGALIVPQPAEHPPEARGEAPPLVVDTDRLPLPQPQASQSLLESAGRREGVAPAHRTLTRARLAPSPEVLVEVQIARPGNPPAAVGGSAPAWIRQPEAQVRVQILPLGRSSAVTQPALRCAIRGCALRWLVIRPAHQTPPGLQASIA